MDFAAGAGHLSAAVAGSCGHHGTLLHTLRNERNSKSSGRAGGGAGRGAGWVVVLEPARREFHRRVCRPVVADWAGTRAVLAKLWQRRFRARPLHVFAIDRICDSSGNGAATAAL